MKLGVFGGTFDPVHVGHLIIAQEVVDSGLVDRILFMPAGEPWLKSSRRVSSAGHRLAMVRLAVGDASGLGVSDMEVRRPGPTYTVDTLEQLAGCSGNGQDIYFVLGADAAADLERWHTPGRLFDLSTVVVVKRAGVPESGRSLAERFGEAAIGKVIPMDAPAIGISGAEIRKRVAEGQSIRYLVPAPVEGYISEHGLYRIPERSLDGPTD